jgi:hypothetical protein
MIMSRATVLALVAIASWAVAGCQPGPAPLPRETAAGNHAAEREHDHEHDHGHGGEGEHHRSPETLAAGVVELRKLLTTIGDDLAAGRTEAADDAVHMVGHVLEDLQVLLPKAELPEEAVAAVKRGVNDLFDCFDDLDTALHAPPGKSAPPAEVHAGLAERIQAALGGIEGAVKPRTGEK